MENNFNVEWKEFQDEEKNLLNEEKIFDDRRNFLKKIWTILWAVWIFWASDLLAKPNDKLYEYQEKVFKKIWLDKIFNEFPELNWEWVKLWYIVSNKPNLKNDVWDYKIIDFYWFDYEKDRLEHANWMISILKSKKNNGDWISWILPQSNFNAFVAKNKAIDIERIYWEWINLIWSSIISIWYRNYKEIEKFLKNNNDLVFIRAGWNKNEKLISSPKNNLEKSKSIFTVWACNLDDNIHNFSAKECDFYINTWEKWNYSSIVESWWSDYFLSNCTSEAAAILTWIIWLLRQILPNSSREDIKNILQKSARKKYSDW